LVHEDKTEGNMVTVKHGKIKHNFADGMNSLLVKMYMYVTSW
jgi:hypothetical protein